MAYSFLFSARKRLAARDLSQIRAMFMSSIAMIVGLALIVLISKVQGFTAVAQFAFWATAQQVAAFFCTFGLSSFAIRQISRSKGRSKTFQILKIHFFIVFVIANTIAFVLPEFGYFDYKTSFAIFTCIWLAVLRYIVEDICIGFGWFSRASGIAMVENFVRLSGVYWSNLETPFGTCLVLIISTASAIISFGMPAVKQLMVSSLIMPRRAYFSKLYSNASLLFAAQCTALAYSRLPIFAAPLIFNGAVAGSLITCLSMSDMVQKGGLLINRYLYSSASQRSNDRQGVNVKKIFRLAVTAIFLLALFLIVTFPFLDSVIFGLQLQKSYPYFIWLVIYSSLFAIFNLRSNILYGLNDSKAAFVGAATGICTSILAILFSFLFSSPMIFCIGLAFATFVSLICTYWRLWFAFPN